MFEKWILERLRHVFRELQLWQMKNEYSYEFVVKVNDVMSLIHRVVDEDFLTVDDSYELSNWGEVRGKYLTRFTKINTIIS